MEISSLFLGHCSVLKELILPSIERASKENFCWVSRASCSISIIFAIKCSSFSWLCLRKERVALVLSCALSVDAPFPFLHLLLVLAHFGAASFLLTPLDDLDWKYNDLKKAISSSSESEFGNCDLEMLLVPDDASDRTFFEASSISLSKALFTAVDLLILFPQALHPYHKSFGE